MKRSTWVIGSSITAFLFVTVFALHTNSALSQTTGNRAPVARAKFSINGGTYSSAVTVTRGVPVTVAITAGERGSAGSFDPDGWATPLKGVAPGGKIEWNSDLNLGPPTYERTFTNPALPLSADMNLGQKTFTLAPGRYTYNMLRITDAGGLVSNIGTVELTVLANPNENRPPIAIAKMSINQGEYRSNVTVPKGVPVNVRITAGEYGSPGSTDPDGWATPVKGVASGGKIEWNSDLNLGSPTYETVFSNPLIPLRADMDLGQKTFTLALGTYTYNLLKITDASGAVSNVGTVELTVVEPCDDPNGYDGDPNGYDGQGGCDDPNGYDGGGDNGYDSEGSALNSSGTATPPSSSFAATITSPASGSSVSQGEDIAVNVSANAIPACGVWIFLTPSGESITLSAEDFVLGKMPWTLPACSAPK